MPRTHRLKAHKTVEAQKPRSIFTDGLIVAGATAAAYLITFAYEYGYCTYFGVPGFLIEPSPGTVLFTAFCMSVGGVVLVEWSYIPRVLLAEIPWPKLRFRLLVVALIWGAPALMGMPFKWLALVNQILWTLLVLADYIFALIFQSGSFAERMLRGERASDTSRSPWTGPTKTFGAMAVGLALFAYFSLLIAWVSGTIHARFQEGFVVLKSAPDFAVIKRYGDRFVAIRYEGASPRATGEFRVVEQKADLHFTSLDKLTIESVRRRTNDDRRGKD